MSPNRGEGPHVPYIGPSPDVPSRRDPEKIDPDAALGDEERPSNEEEETGERGFPHVGPKPPKLKKEIPDDDSAIVNPGENQD